MIAGWIQILVKKEDEGLDEVVIEVPQSELVDIFPMLQVIDGGLKVVVGTSNHVSEEHDRVCKYDCPEK